MGDTLRGSSDGSNWPDGECPFCDLVGRGAVEETTHPGVVVIEPLRPVTPGHLLVVPRGHLRDATQAPFETGVVFAEASRIAERYPAANLITSIGRDATQSVFHLHVHVVPRRAGDGLRLPWTDQP